MRYFEGGSAAGELAPKIRSYVHIPESEAGAGIHVPVYATGVSPSLIMDHGILFHQSVFGSRWW
jgi:hypothetical protein